VRSKKDQEQPQPQPAVEQGSQRAIEQELAEELARRHHPASLTEPPPAHRLRHTHSRDGRINDLASTNLCPELSLNLNRNRGTPITNLIIRTWCCVDP
jgi:hypothetical protein